MEREERKWRAEKEENEKEDEKRKKKKEKRIDKSWKNSSYNNKVGKSDTYFDGGEQLTSEEKIKLQSECNPRRCHGDH